MNTPPANPVGRVSRARASAGFSQADLVLVLAGLSLLAAIALPTTARSREKARLAQCLDNLKKVNGAVLQYAEEHGRTLPLLNDSPAPGGWWFYKEEVKSYLGLSGPSSAADKVFACPSDRGYGMNSEQTQPFWRSPKFNFTSYVYNGVTLAGVPSVAGRSLSSIQNPAVTLLTMEWVAHAPLSWHASRTGVENTPFYCDAESVVGFVDGHVALTPIYYDGINAAYTRDPVPGYAYKFSGD
jgi:type II secretory pathway pseudopilin PulG